MAHAGLFYAAAIWGSTFFMVKQATDGVHPVTLIAYRFLIAAVIMLVYLVATRRPLFRDLGRGLLLGSIIWILYVAQTIGLTMTTAANSGFITGLFVVFIPVFLAILFKSNPPKLEWLAAIVAIAGLWVLTGGLKQMNSGDALTLVAPVTYALHVLLTDRFMKRGADPIALTFQQFAIVGLLSLLTMVVFRIPTSVQTSGTTWAIVFLALFPTLSAYIIQVFAQRIISPVRVSLIFAFEPVFAGLFAWTLGGETVHLSSALGGFLIFVALLISGFSAPTQSQAERSGRMRE